MKRNSDIYFDNVDALAGATGNYFLISPRGELPVVSVVSYKDVPEKGCITSFSYGLSSRSRPEWIHSRPEFIISVRSEDSAWGQCMGEIIYQLDSDGRVAYGTVINFKEQVCDESQMTSFLIFCPSLLLGDDAKMVLPDRIIHFSQLYPIYESEAEVIHRVGAEHFFCNMGIDFTDVKRAPAV